MGTHIEVGVGVGHRAASNVAGGARGLPVRYRGRDRRGLVVEERRLPGRGFAFAVAISLGTAVPVVVGHRTIEIIGPKAALVEAQLDGAVLALTLPLAVLFLIRWRLTSEAAAAWLGTGLGLYGLLTVGVGQVVGPAVSAGGEVAVVLPAAARLVAVALVGAALVAPEIDADLRPLRVFAGAFAAAALLAVVLWQVPHARPPLEVVAAMWMLAGVACLVGGVRQRRHLLTWCGLGLLMLGLANVAAIGSEVGAGRDLVAPLLRLIGLVWALAGVTRGLARVFQDQSGRLLTSLTAEGAARSAAEAQRAYECERVHEARNALATIEAATLALGLHDSSDDPDHAVLTRALRSEIRRLSDLVDPRSTPAAAASFVPVRDVVAGVAAAARAQGCAATVDVAEHVWAWGDPVRTTQVLHNLLQNARRYGAGSVHIAARAEGAQVVIEVVDDGPGIPAAERAAIFERGIRGSTAGDTVGDGLGLSIASRLMAEQAGDLRLEDRQGPGACFAVTLPAAPALGQEVVDEGQERRQVGVAS